MKKLIYLITLLVCSVNFVLARDYNITYNRQEQTVTFNIRDYHLRPVTLNGNIFTKIVFENAVSTNDKGFAELPFLHANLMLDDRNNISVEVISKEFTDYQVDYPPVPSRGVIYRDQDPSKVAYMIAPESITDSFYPENLISTTDPFIIKDVRGATIYAYPFRYNAAQGTLRVFTKITVKISTEKSQPVNPLTIRSTKKFSEMEGLYRSLFLNYDAGTDDLSVAEAGDILVITTARDEAAIQPYIDWKMEKGYNVSKEVVPTGTNVKTLIQQKYVQNPDILYVQLVGDWADIKCDVGGGENAPLDPKLGCVSGSDNYPDIAIGRFSATSPSQVTIQVDKVINYEKNPSGNWYGNAIGVASNQGPGDDNELDYEQVQVIYDNKLDPFTYDNYSYAYDPNANASMVAGYIQNGAGIINYCGHGSMTSWGSSGFSNTNVNQLSNGSMLPVIFSVACLNGAFHNGECFAEAWLKKSGGGAVMTLMSTINQPWDPPMRGQDYFNDILTGGYNYSSNPGNGINTNEGRTTAGAIVANGLTLMYTESNSTSDLNTIQTWTIFGDPSMQIRTKAADEITLSGTALLTGSPFSTNVTSAGSPVEGAMVCLSQNGIYESGYTDVSGNITLQNNFEPGDVKLVVTAFNKQTIDQSIENIPPSGPYIMFENIAVNNSNGQLDCGETAGLNLTLRNNGIESAQNVVATISTNDPMITIGNNTANFSNIEAGGNAMVENAFLITASGTIPDGHSCSFSLSMTDGNDTWDGSFSIAAHSPQIIMASLSIDDSDGNNNQMLDPGENVQFVITVKNNGSGDASGVNCTLSSSNPLITIQEPQQALGALATSSSKIAGFGIAADGALPVGSTVSFSFETETSTGLSTSETFQVVVGQIPVLIIDLDENNNSASAIASALDELNITYEEATAIPVEPQVYSTIFLCLGIYADNHVLSASEGDLLAGFLNDGGNLYMEGGDTWYYDTQTAVHSMFGIDATSDGSGDMGTVNGVSGMFTEGMAFVYTGDNNWMDHLEAASGAELILENASPSYGCAVAREEGSYKTIGTSFEFGGLSNNESTKTELMEQYATFFGLLGPEAVYADFTASFTEVLTGETINFASNCSGPVTTWEWDFNNDGTIDSNLENPSWSFNQPGTYSVKLTAWGNEGQHSEMVKENFITVTEPAMTFNPVWDSPYNPMSIYITGATINGTDLQADAQIGVFDTDPVSGNEICVGTGTLTGVLSQGNFLEIIASMDDGSNPDEANGFTPGNAFIFKFIDNDNQIVEPVNYSFPYNGYDEVFAPQGSAIVQLTATAEPPEQQNLELREGWTAVSSYLVPQNTAMASVVASVVPEPEMVQNLSGYYQPTNVSGNLQTWDYKSGYFIKMNQATTLTISGFQSDDRTISLQPGWNLVSVITTSPVAISEIFNANMDKLEIVKMPAGTEIFWPAMSIFSLTTFEPGKAYLVKASEGFTITYQ